MYISRVDAESSREGPCRARDDCDVVIVVFEFFTKLRGPGEQRSCKYASSATEVLRRGHESAGSLVFFSRCRNVRAVKENTTVGAS